MYSQFDNNSMYQNQKSSFGLPCSDQRLNLFDIMLSKANQKAKKPADISSKIKQAKKDYLNYDTVNYKTELNSYYPFTKLQVVDNSTNNNFKQKFYELAKLSGNDIERKKESKVNIYPIFQVNNQDNKKGKKSDLLKKQIMLEIAKDSSDCNSSIKPLTATASAALPVHAPLSCTPFALFCACPRLSMPQSARLLNP